MKVFVTGYQGYIGTHLVGLLKSAGHEVTGHDIGLFDGCEWDQYVMPDHFCIKDVRDIEESDLNGHDVLIHLAAISNDPMGDLDENLTYEINREGSIRLAHVAKSAGIKRFLFSSSCSIYGKGSKQYLEETDPTAPLTAYAVSKIAAEEAISKLCDEKFTAAYLRNATAYGYSPNLRIDLVVNNLLGSAKAYGKILIKSDGSPWRPLIHCKDIARAFVAFAEAPREVIDNQIVNIGGNKENFQVKDVANLVQKVMPKAKIEFTGEVGEDPRNYCVSFNKLNKLLPDFELEYTLEKGIDELNKAYDDKNFSKEDFEGDQFVRLKTLKKRMGLIQR